MDAAYARLRRIAQRLLGVERQGHTLSATEVVHEALAKLLMSGQEPARAAERDFAAFVRNASRAMTEVLIDHARRRDAGKRGGGRRPVRLDDLNDLERTLARYGGDPSETAGAFDWSALHDALELLRQVDARRHDVIVLRFFAGLDNRQIARQLGVDERTVGRDFAAARLWLKERLSRAG